MEPIEQSQQSHSSDFSTNNNQLADDFIELAKLWKGGEDLNPNIDRDRSVIETADKIRGMDYDVGDLIDREGAGYIRMHDDWSDLSFSNASDLKLLAFGLTPQQAHKNRITIGG